MACVAALPPTAAPLRRPESPVRAGNAKRFRDDALLANNSLLFYVRLYGSVNSARVFGQDS